MAAQPAVALDDADRHWSTAARRSFAAIMAILWPGGGQAPGIVNGFQVAIGLLLLSVTAATSLAEERAARQPRPALEHAAFDAADRAGEMAGRFSGGSAAGDPAGARDLGARPTWRIRGRGGHAPG